MLTDNSRPLFVLADDSAYGVRLSSGEADISKVSVGDRVDIIGSGFEGTYAAYVAKICPTAKKELSGTTCETAANIAKGKIYIGADVYGARALLSRSAGF